ncbi:hypothetical protein LBLM1_11115 (plasmid) [Limosilactobacillus mucosae LM1]|uniref:Uncharacterized protein n=1 Tax=Limosilactobacillus mucosae LM1 TaxID=1130798 RepID=A0A0D4CN89_LIMMU|nr:hypothetical protein [Limosilactobacillus mucosae]AJT51573.1 hypothetical protein LBLM1_11115 [Limosilactobacillus mucosae LM1]
MKYDYQKYQKYQKPYKSKHKVKNYRYQKKSRAKSFIKNDATLDELYEFDDLTKNRIKELEAMNMKTFDITVWGTRADGSNIGYYEFKYDDGEELWQAMSEDMVLVDNSDEKRLIEWQDLPDDNIEHLLNAAKKQGFIDDFELEESNEDDD